MSYRIFGAILVIAASSMMGFSVAMVQKKEEMALQQLISGLQFMISELQYRMLPLPVLCELTAKQTSGPIRTLFECLQQQLLEQKEVDASKCMLVSIKAVPKLPELPANNLVLLGKNLGRFDLEGQISGIHSVLELCRRDLQGLQMNQDVRFRTYRTLGICAGIALVILFI